MTIELTTLSLGAGLQSSTIVEMIVEGELSPIDAAIFADTGDEPQYVYDQVIYLRSRLATVDIPLITAQRNHMIKDIYHAKKRSVALPLFTKQTTTITGFGRSASRPTIGRLQRQCTKDYKIEPIWKEIRRLLLAKGMARQDNLSRIYPSPGIEAEIWLGISMDEAERIKPNPVPHFHNRWPLIELRMTRNDCRQWLEDRGLPIAQKSSCIRCPFHDDAYYLEMQENRPDDWQTVVGWDHDLRNGRLHLSATAKGQLYQHRQCIPLDEVDLQPPADNGQMSFAFCDEGHCWT
jgi:hypothetical protein